MCRKTPAVEADNAGSTPGPCNTPAAVPQQQQQHAVNRVIQSDLIPYAMLSLAAAFATTYEKYLLTQLTVVAVLLLLASGVC